jgi:hypothetical protein
MYNGEWRLSGVPLVVLLVAACSTAPSIGQIEQHYTTIQGTQIEGSAVPGGTASIVGVAAGLSVTGGGLTTVPPSAVPPNALPARLRLSNGATLTSQIQITGSHIHDSDLINGNPANMFDPSALYGNQSNANGNVGAAANRDIVFYNVQWWSSNTRAWVPLCPAENEAIALQGTWGNPDPVTGRFDRGRWVAPTTEITFACTNGVLAKCARWGYKPWTTASGVDLAPLHRACVRAAAADFCSDGTSYTTDGTQIDVFDIYGFIRSATESIDPGSRFESLCDVAGPCPADHNWSMEATFDEGGGGCIRHSRKVTLPADCRTDYELDCELNDRGRPVCILVPTGTSSAIDVLDDAGFPTCMDDSGSNGRPQLIGVKDHNVM